MRACLQGRRVTLRYSSRASQPADSVPIAEAWATLGRQYGQAVRRRLSDAGRGRPGNPRLFLHE
jgi:hypothetical protein